MPLPRPCLTPSCPNRTTRARCAVCESQYQSHRNADPRRAAYKDPAYRAIPLGPACVDCGATHDLTRDHVVPLAAGGSNHPSNIATRCRRCNSAKGAHKKSTS